jgi:hypothetical protein
MQDIQEFVSAHKLRLSILEAKSNNVTYVVSHTEALHPDPTVTSRMHEVAISKCEFGCKIYADPLSDVRVLAHNSNYGCRK